MKYQLILSDNQQQHRYSDKEISKKYTFARWRGWGLQQRQRDAKHAKLHDHSQKHEPCEVMTQFSECEISNQKKAKREMIRKKYDSKQFSYVDRFVQCRYIDLYL